jgi:hypothetical protein
MNKPPTWYYIVAGLATFWALIGCYAYISDVSMGPAEMAALPAVQREIYAMTPAWVNGFYAIAVWSGLAGAIGLLLRMRYARLAYIISLVAVVIQFGWTFAATPILSKMGFAEAAGFPIFIALVCVALIWLAGKATRSGWLR